MIPIQSEPSEWTSDDCKFLRDFLNSVSGQKALAWVSHNAPVLGDGGDVNKTLVTCGEVRGFGKALAELISLTYEKPLKVQDNAGVNETFPDLDNDAAWPADGPAAERPRQPK